MTPQAESLYNKLADIARQRLIDRRADYNKAGLEAEMLWLVCLYQAQLAQEWSLRDLAKHLMHGHTPMSLNEWLEENAYEPDIEEVLDEMRTMP